MLIPHHTHVLRQPLHLFRLICSEFDMLLSTVLQAALATVQAYPYTVDVPALAEAAALELGEPPAPALLSGSG